jgi:hypothetical protein
MNIKKVDKDKFEVESSKPGKFYKVDNSTPFCECAHFKFRMLKMGGVCKHIKAIRELIQKQREETGNNDELLNYLKENEETDIIEVIEKFDEEQVNALLESGQAIEYRGKIKLME